MEKYFKRKVLLLKGGVPVLVTRNVTRHHEGDAHVVVWEKKTIEVQCRGSMKDPKAIWEQNLIQDIDMHDETFRFVEDGAFCLSISNPSWANLVDLSLLDMRQGRKCILGQVYGSYVDGLIHLCLESDLEACEKGFLASESRYSELQLAWILKILELRESN